MMLGEQICRRFSFAEIQSATHNFDDALIIGQGGFGKVYKGVIDDGASTVAVKQLNPMSKQGVTEFRTEIDMLSKFRHCHLVSLIGYCDDSDDMIIIYDYMIRGTLADHLYKKVGKDGNSPLSWVQRLKICIGVARGLDYLHTGTGVLFRVIHRDVKSSNILIDENWAAKISDFGLSKIGSTNHGSTDVITKVKGTPGYLDPDYFLTLRLTRKSDVYSFGVVLMEVLCGRPALDPRLQWEQRSLARWTQHCIKEKRVSEIIDPNLKWEIFPNSLMTFVELANQCLHNDPKKRPTMSSVVTRLEQALAFQGLACAYTEEEIKNDATISSDNQRKERPYKEQLDKGLACAYTEEEIEDGGQHDGQNDATISSDNQRKERPYKEQLDKGLACAYTEEEIEDGGQHDGQNDATISSDNQRKERSYEDKWEKVLLLVQTMSSNNELATQDKDATISSNNERIKHMYATQDKDSTISSNNERIKHMYATQDKDATISSINERIKLFEKNERIKHMYATQDKDATISSNNERIKHMFEKHMDELESKLDSKWVKTKYEASRLKDKWDDFWDKL